MFKFKPADPTLRRPAFLQDRTKENIIFQTSTVVILMLVVWLKEEYDLRQMEKQLQLYDDYPSSNNE